MKRAGLSHPTARTDVQGDSFSRLPSVISRHERASCIASAALVRDGESLGVVPISVAEDGYERARELIQET